MPSVDSLPGPSTSPNPGDEGVKSKVDHAASVQGEKASMPRVGADSKPLVEPPTLGDRIRDTDKEPYWIPGAFPTIFQNETGDPFNYVWKEPDLVTWGRMS